MNCLITKALLFADGTLTISVATQALTVLNLSIVAFIGLDRFLYIYI